MGTGERKHTEAQVVAHVAGSREEALAELERRARSYSPPHPLSPRRRRLLRVGDGFLLVVDGAWQSFVTRFTVAELLTDSAAPRAPEPEPEPRPEPAPEAEAAPEPVAAAAAESVSSSATVNRVTNDCQAPSTTSRNPSPAAGRRRGLSGWGGE
ncbi:hypothetical protein [Streptomyces sp. LRa12]|uniref:hypothetical protein n=1 Tax=Streptomyces sp. LRa12 TaxID=2563107 RepID=UPI001F0E6FA5|nr:hypothetical protein [Streptomyces sp. LRa12]